MSLGENIQFYRKKAGVTQEHLAERLEVSRQSISKWESNTTYPEMDKLLQMCDMFSCSLDTLLRGDAESASVEDTEKYDQHMNGFSRVISIGVGLLFFGVSVLLVLMSLKVMMPLSVAAMLVFVVSGILAMTYAGMGHDAYTRKHPNIRPFYTEDQIEEAERRFRLRMTFSIGLMFASVLWLVLSFALPTVGDFGRNLYIALFMLVLGISISIMTHSGMDKDKFDIEKYNRSNTPEAKLAEAQNSGENSAVGKWCGVVFMLAIGAYLVLGFGFQMWHPGWIAFPVAIFLCAIGAIVGRGGRK